jgi:hypothetical protein
VKREEDVKKEFKTGEIRRKTYRWPLLPPVQNPQPYFEERRPVDPSLTFRASSIIFSRKDAKSAKKCNFHIQIQKTMILFALLACLAREQSFEVKPV